MHAGQARLVVIEMSGPDSLSDAVRRQVHFGRTHPEYQLTKALGVHRGAITAQKQQLSDLQMHINVVCACVWPRVTCLCLSRGVGFTPLSVFS